MAYQPNYMNPGYYMYGANGVNNNMQQPAQRYQPPMEQQYIQPQPIYKQPIGLQGKTVDSIDVVKAMDIPLDGSVSYFTLTDGSAIISKQLMQDGTSKVIIYKPVDENEIKDSPKFVTMEEFDEKIKNFNNNELRDDLKSIKRQIKDLQEDMEDINKDLKKRKD